ncbi:hypothetical protein [Campylobacter sp.]|uniref:hypothetical protein n=1 Tax=Campylobacter sp. TaxID=205 RepID=UPI002A7EADC6|nr:hypothetical protein [Campylobacter sp.]MDY4445346.1 hypothetical protein [Campylobacter sp.]
MKYFVRILAFLFISFSFGFCKGLHPIKELLYYTNEITSYSDISSLGVNTDKKNISNVGTIFIPLSYFKYFFKSPIDGRLFYLYVRDYESKLDHIFYQLDSTSTSITFYYFKNPVMKFQYRNWEFIAVTYIDSLDEACFGNTTFNGFFCVLKGYDVPCLNPDYYFSEKLGKCIPACPEGAYYNSFSEECTSTCDNVSNREERFDCLCKERGFGGYKSSRVSMQLVFTNTPNGAFSNILYTGTIYCSIGELNSGDVSDYLKNKGYDDKDLEQATSDFFEINDVIDKNNFSDSGSSGGSSDSSGGEQGSAEPLTPEQQKQEQDRNECKAIVSAITADFRAYTQKYVNNGIDCSDDRAVQLARDAKSTIEMKVQTYNQSKCATVYHKIDFNVPIHSCKTDPTKPDPIEPPAPQNPSESIKYDENTNTLTITDSTGNTQAVTPSNVTKDDKGELQSIEYTDPETGKTIEYKTKEDGTWERIEYPGQGTNPNENDSGTGQGDGKPGGSSDGEGAGTSEDGKKDGNEEGDGKFEGGEFGALGNANDFDEGGELTGLYDSLSEKESENNGILDSIISDGFGLVNDVKQSIDNIKETAEDLKKNPFSSSSVTSCAIDLKILDISSQIDLCKYTSQFKTLFSSIFFVFLNIMVGFAFFKILILLLINI